MVRTKDEYINGVMKRLDGLQERISTINRLQLKTHEPKILDDLLTLYKTYEIGLGHLQKLNAKEEYRAYKVWYQRHLNVGDPL
jgi:hypothetical protein